MFKNYLKIIFRGLLKNKGYSFLNIFGLAIGITAAALIFLWVEDELNYDSIFPNREEVHYILTNQSFDGKTYTFGSTPAKMAPALKEEISGIKYATRMASTKELFKNGNKSIYKSGAYIDADFFNIFSLNFIEGNAENAFDDVNSIVINKKTAEQFFGDYKNSVGKIVRVQNKIDRKISGVVEDFPDNVTVKFDWLGHFETYAKGNDNYQHWGNNSVNTYVQLNKGVDFDAVNKQVIAMIPEKKGDEEASIYGFLHSMKDWRLHGKFEEGKQVGGKIENVRLFSIIAIIILIIACINFMNLATARSQKRAGEVGVRKVLGSSRKQLISQFFSEAIIIAFVAGVLSVVLVYFLLPQFNQIINKELTIGFTSPLHWAVLIIVILTCGLLSGFYPALYLSSFRPAAILKGVKTKGGASFIRNGLVVTQFAASIVLIIATIIVYTQIKHVQNRDLGFNKDNLLAINLKGEVVKKYDGIRDEMLNTGMIESVGLNSIDLLSDGWNGWGYNWKGKAEETNPLVSFRMINNGFFKTANMKIIDGRNFKKDYKLDENQVIITKTFADLIDSENSVVGRYLWRGDDETDKMQIVGVVNNYQYGDMYGKSDPVIFHNHPEGAKYLYVKIKEDSNIKEAVSSLSAIMKAKNPAFPFEYNFVDEQFNNYFKNEKLVEKLSQIFAILAILISCFGLFGLAAYMAEQRSKEIGVRKVLGATVSNIVNLLSKDFLKLVFISIIIAVPLAWLFMSNWLEGFKYRIDISWWMFVMAAALAIVIALFTVSFQAIKAAVQNPVKSIRTE